MLNLLLVSVHSSRLLTETGTCVSRVRAYRGYEWD